MVNLWVALAVKSALQHALVGVALVCFTLLQIAHPPHAAWFALAFGTLMAITG